MLCHLFFKAQFHAETALQDYPLAPLVPKFHLTDIFWNSTKLSFCDTIYCWTSILKFPKLKTTSYPPHSFNPEFPIQWNNLQVPVMEVQQYCLKVKQASKWRRQSCSQGDRWTFELNHMPPANIWICQISKQIEIRQLMQLQMALLKGLWKYQQILPLMNCETRSCAFHWNREVPF